jgi:DNA-directed RNA polymerase specialized sigma24 family protein
MFSTSHNGSPVFTSDDIQTASDLRRRIPRDLADILVLRASHLLPEDRALISAVYQDNLSAIQVAELLNVSPRAIRRRIRVLVQRLLSPRFEFVTRRSRHWGPTRRKVARACVLEGRTLRDAADTLGLTLHTVRRHMDAIAAQQEALRA